MDSSTEMVTKKELLIELGNELHYHSNGGTRYRRETTELAIIVASQIHDVTIFFNRKKAYDAATEMLINQDEDRLQDISKMLSVIIRDLENQKTLPEDVKAFANAKMKDFKFLKFK